MIIHKWTEQAYEDALEEIKQARELNQPLSINRITPQRSRQANNYYHFILRWVASQYGATKFEVEQMFKQVVNPDIFVKQKVDKQGNVRTEIRSSADLDWKEMSSALDNFKSYCLSYMGLRIPEPDDDDGIRRCKIEIDKVKQYI